ncbi:MAG: BamA/TamA family outer membrane protein [bacterium]
MNERTASPRQTGATPQPGRRNTGFFRPGGRVRLCLALLLLLCAPAGASPASTAAADTVAVADNPSRTLRLAGVELEGATRTPLATVYRYLPLRPGQTIDQPALVEAVERLRAGGLFRSVAFYTRPGAERGQLILVLEVQEHRLDLRWTAGNTNLDGWYLSPATLAYDNPSGRGDRLDLQWRIGFRHGGLLLRYDRPRADRERDYWGARLSVMGTDRPYFAGGVEFQHHVGISGLQGVYGRALGGDDLIEFGLGLETVDVDDHATAVTAAEDESIAIDQEVPASLLPEPVQQAMGRRSRAVLHADWQHDTRSAQRRADSPVSGAWGRIKGHAVLQDQRSHAGLQADLRLFREAPGGVLALRLRGAWVGSHAQFHDRLYLGGMYSVRGFATHSLSAPGGDTWLWSGSVEYRSTILGDARGSKLTGLFFLDAGAAGSSDAPDPYPGLAAAVGYGIRWRVWWLDRVGVDVGFPLTDRPLDQRFQATASIGWCF